MSSALAPLDNATMCIVLDCRTVKISGELLGGIVTLIGRSNLSVIRATLVVSGRVVVTLVRVVRVTDSNEWSMDTRDSVVEYSCGPSLCWYCSGVRCV